MSNAPGVALSNRLPTRRMCCGLAVCLVLAAGCAATRADGRAKGVDVASGSARIIDGGVRLAAGDYALVMKGGYAWTIRSLSWKGVSIMTEHKTCSNGTVLKARDFLDDKGHAQWVGTGHGNETVKSVHLFVDGREKPVRKDAEYAGAEFKLVKQSDLKILTLEARTRLTASGLTETHRYTAKADSPPLALLYCFMHSFDVKMLDWLAHRADGSVARGTFGNKGKTPFTSDNVDWAAVYNAAGGVGAVYAVRNASGRLHHFFWDRPFDQKLYYEAHPNVDTLKAGGSFTYSVALAAFESAADGWAARATALAREFQGRAPH